jgi:uncharacterized membrane protein YdjX (TVP38/TMEM64 family)
MLADMLAVIFHVWQSFLAFVGHANPVLLFLCVAILPLIGCPASPLLVAIGIRLGTAYGMALVAAAYLVNFTAGYWLARGVFSAPLSRWLERRGQRIPSVSAADETQLILLIRITPGPPLFMQTYMLGLARVGFVRYLVLSMLVQMGYSFALLSVGQSLNHNAAWHIILAVGLVIGVALAVNLFRRWLMSRRLPAPGIVAIAPSARKSV